MEQIHVDRFQQVMDLITAKPRRHDQAVWGERTSGDEGYEFANAAVCGTTACVAGWATALNGYSLVFRPDYELADFVVPNAVAEQFRKAEARGATEGELENLLLSSECHIRTVAAELLGLCDTQASWLFDGDNNILGLWAMAFLFTNGRITLPQTAPQGWDLAPDQTPRAAIAAAVQDLVSYNEFIDPNNYGLTFNDWRVSDEVTPQEWQSQLDALYDRVMEAQ